MKNEEQRIWNKSELEKMNEWSMDEDGDWVNGTTLIFSSMVGKPIKRLKHYVTITPEMIAKTEQPKTAIAANGTELVVGGRYRLEWWKNEFFEILFIGEVSIFVKYETGFECSYLINNNWLPYEPKEEAKPLIGYQKRYIHLDRNVVKLEYMTTEQAEDLKSKSHILGVYTEQEAVDLGLKL